MHVPDLELRRIAVIAPGHAEIAHDELGKNVRLKPKNIRMAAKRAQVSGYSRPVIFGHQ